MKYCEALDFLYTQLPMYQRVGASAYKPGLDNVLILSKAFGDPHHSFRSIHVGGTNGKGSTSHTIAAVLQSAGYKVGLYTSPHLVDFRERIRVNGAMISEEAVIDFTERFMKMSLPVSPSFFELTMVMAFEYFAKCCVDVAVVEVGLGGRLDSTNILCPHMCVITNISFDHMQFLGNTLTAIASEKAGIIKPGVPVVIGEAQGDVRKVFEKKAAASESPVRFAEDIQPFKSVKNNIENIEYPDSVFGNVTGELTGDYQIKNTATVMTALQWLRELKWNISDDAVKNGFSSVVELTGLSGRWMKVAESPLTVCDTGHNEGGWHYLARQIERSGKNKHMVIGFVSDKDVSHILELMPLDATYYFTKASVDRAMDASKLCSLAKKTGLRGEAYPDVMSAYRAARSNALKEDLLFVGGSTFVVADFLSGISGQQ